MSPGDKGRQELEDHWRRAADRALASATEQLGEYGDEAVDVIRAELRRRGMPDPGPPSVADRHDPPDSGAAQALERLKEYTPRIPVTITVVALNLLAFGVMVISGVPPFDPDAQTLFEWGGNYAPWTLRGEEWRLITCIFVHAGVIHLAINMWVLIEYGPVAERIYGNLAFLVLYILSGLSASVISMWWNPAIVSVGASGAIFGVAGALIPFFLRADSPLDLKGKRSQLWSLLGFVAYNINAGLQSEGVDNAAHIGGLLAGLLLGFCLSRPLPPLARIERRRVRVIIPATTLSVLAAMFLLATQITHPLSGEDASERGDHASAAQEFRKAAELGFPEGQYNLAIAYFQGLGVPHDEAQGVEWARKAAAQEFVLAQFILGLAYANGEGVAEDLPEAVEWFRKAAAQEFAPAQFHLGLVYARGRGVAEDDVRAVEWYRKAADQGLADAQYTLGVAYSYGHGVPEDDSEAARWYRKGAYQEHARAQSNLARAYYNGTGVPEDHGEATRWFGRSAENFLEGSQWVQASATFRALGRLSDALAASQKAVETEPTNAAAYKSLGDSLLWNLRPREAIDAYREGSGVQWGLGVALAVTGESEAALREFRRHTRTRRLYSTLWQSLILRRLGQEAAARRLLKDFLEDAETAGWPKDLVGVQLGDLAPEEARQRASNRSQTCEARFYVGYRALIEGDETTATKELQQVVAAQCFADWEHVAARSLLLGLD